MTQNSILFAKHIRLRPRARAYMAKAMALAVLAVLATSLPAHGHGPDAVVATQEQSGKSHSDSQNIPPVAVTDYVDMATAKQGFNMLANDTDANRDTLRIIDASAKYGAIAYTADGLVAYAASAAQPLADEIDYTLSDGRGGSAKGKVLISVR